MYGQGLRTADLYLIRSDSNYMLMKHREAQAIISIDWSAILHPFRPIGMPRFFFVGIATQSCFVYMHVFVFQWLGSIFDHPGGAMGPAEVQGSF